MECHSSIAIGGDQDGDLPILPEMPGRHFVGASVSR
jgi:hypothetical protein